MASMIKRSLHVLIDLLRGSSSWWGETVLCHIPTFDSFHLVPQASIIIIDGMK